MIHNAKATPILPRAPIFHLRHTHRLEAGDDGRLAGVLNALEGDTTDLVHGAPDTRV